MLSSNPSSVLSLPKLASDGSNWIIYKSHITSAITAKGLNRFLTGTAQVPKEPPKYETPTPEQEAEIEASLTLADKFLTSQAEARNIILSSIPDSLAYKVIQTTTAKEMWEIVCKEHEGKTIMFAMETRRRLQNAKCGENDDLRLHFSTLNRMQEELASMGAPLQNDEFCNIICGSLPMSYSTTLASFFTAARLVNARYSAADLCALLEQEYDRRIILSGSEGATALSATKATSINPSRSGKRCNNCRRLGHFKADCWKKGGGKEGQGPKQKSKPGDSGSTQANAVILNDSGVEQAWTSTFSGNELARNALTH
jgi:hypothetical protein